MANLLSRIIAHIRSGSLLYDQYQRGEEIDSFLNKMIDDPSSVWEIRNKEYFIPGDKVFVVLINNVPIWVSNFPYATGTAYLNHISQENMEAIAKYGLRANQMPYPITRYKLARELEKRLPIFRFGDTFYLN